MQISIYELKRSNFFGSLRGAILIRILRRVEYRRILNLADSKEKRTMRFTSQEEPALHAQWHQQS